MSPIDGLPVVTAEEMRAAEAAAVAAGDAYAAMMDRAGRAVAEQVRRLAAGAEVLVLCGPGNNGGDGYVAAAALRGAGHPVRVAAGGEPRTDLARAARATWDAPVEPVGDCVPAPVLLDALYGTGLSRPAAEATRLRELAAGARLTIALDLPSGVDADTGALHSEPAACRLTLALGAPKPAHLLQPAACFCGEVRVLDIGVPVRSDAAVLARPALRAPGPDAHKFTRGMVSVIAGAMPGASLLAGEAALRAGAGYVQLLGGGSPGGVHALVHGPLTDETLANPRVGALLVGPGLGRGDDARSALHRALATDRPLVVDGDALHLLANRLDALRGRPAPSILTPHAGEFRTLFGDAPGGKLDRARDAAARSGAVVVFKGADTVIAAPDGRARLAPPGSPWLSTAGTGDVLAGAMAAQLAAGLGPLEAAAAGVWLHADAARRCGAAFVADDLAATLSAARASA